MPKILSLFCFFSAENITAKHIVSNDSSDSDDESQGPKGKRAGNSSGRTALGKTMNVFLINIYIFIIFLSAPKTSLFLRL